MFSSCPLYCCVQGQAHAAHTHVKILHDIAVSDLCILKIPAVFFIYTTQWLNQVCHIFWLFPFPFPFPCFHVFSCPPYVQGQAHAARTHVKLLHDIAVSDLCMLNFLTVVGYLGSVYYAVDTFHAPYFYFCLVLALKT